MGGGMNPSDFDSYCGGVNLTAANYSGGAGGSFTDEVNGAGFWTLNSGTPTFSTESGLEGKDFGGVVGDVVVGKCPCLWEGTMLVIGRVAGTVFYVGGTYASGNSWGVQHNASRIQFFNAGLNSSGFTSPSDFNASAPNVLTSSWCPETGTTYAQANDGTPVSSTNATLANSRSNWPTVGIGQHRTTYFTGWIARVLFFSRALHERDNANLQLLIADQMADIGL
jgi:hypothetical protein